LRKLPELADDEPKTSNWFHTEDFATAPIVEIQAEKIRNYEELTNLNIIWWLNKLKEGFTHLDGLHSPDVFYFINYKPVYIKKFCNVLHFNGNHWICVSNVFCDMGEVVVYDSLETINEKNVKKLKAPLKKMLPRCKSLKVKINKTTIQNNGYDCGLFSLAFTTLICNGKNPSDYEIDRNKVRDHYNKCVDNNEVESFPCFNQPENREENKTKRFFNINL
jgi:hypothetical protein